MLFNVVVVPNERNKRLPKTNDDRQKELVFFIDSFCWDDFD